MVRRALGAAQSMCLPTPAPSTALHARRAAHQWRHHSPPRAAAKRLRARAELPNGTGRVEALPVVYHPSYSAPRLAPGHRFPMQASSALAEPGYRLRVLSDVPLSAAKARSSYAVAHTRAGLWPHL